MAISVIYKVKLLLIKSIFKYILKRNDIYFKCYFITEKSRKYLNVLE